MIRLLDLPNIQPFVKFLEINVKFKLLALRDSAQRCRLIGMFFPKRPLACIVCYLSASS